MRIAFFDLDHTIVDGSTGLYVLYQLMQERRIPIAECGKAIYYTLLYKLNRLPYNEAIRWIYAVCERVQVHDLLRAVDTAYERLIVPRIYQESIDAISLHKKQGDLVCIATASTRYMAELIGRQVGADAVISNRSDFFCKGLHDKSEPTLCFGDGKRMYASYFASDNGVDLNDCIYYSDSPSDMPLLAAVGEPVIVNPQKWEYWYKKLDNYCVVHWQGYATGIIPVTGAMIVGALEEGSPFCL